MIRRRLAISSAAFLVVTLLVGCAGNRPRPLRSLAGESVVLVGVEPAALACGHVKKQSVRVRSTYLPGSQREEFVEGRDFCVDYKEGTLRRLPGSRLPDFRTNSLYGQDGFDHNRFPGFGNGGYFAFVDYAFEPTSPWPKQKSQLQFLQRTLAKLKSGQGLKMIAYGDSITAGGDASKPELVFWSCWAGELQRKYPWTQIQAINGATGGDSTVQGLQRLQAKVLDAQPDLVLIGFGMNDHNLGGVNPTEFERNLKEMIHRIRSATSAEIVLFSAFPPNSKWKFGTHRMADYAAATSHAASQESCAYVDVYSNWQSLTARKKPEDLLGNNINHPNDFGHWIYYRVFCDLGL